MKTSEVLWFGSAVGDMLLSTHRIKPGYSYYATRLVGYSGVRRVVHYRGDVIHKKAIIDALVLVILLAGCTQAITIAPPVESTLPSTRVIASSTLSPSTISQSNLKPIDLQVGSMRVSLTVVQNNKMVPVTIQDNKHAIAALAPDPFSIRLEGNKEATYIVGQADPTQLRALESDTHPLATFDAGYPVFENNDLRILDPPLDVSDDLASFFANSWGGPEQGRKIVNELKGAFGVEPVMIYGGFMLLDPRSGGSDYTIRTIQGIKPAANETFFVTIFLRDRIVGEFDQLAWFTFQITFVAQ